MTLLDKRVRVRNATPLEDFEMLIEFEDGSQKKIDLEPFLHGEIFEPIRNNRKMFQDVRIEWVRLPGPMGLTLIQIFCIMT